jgi:hypothetical protein
MGKNHNSQDARTRTSSPKVTGVVVILQMVLTSVSISSVRLHFTLYIGWFIHRVNVPYFLL